MTLIDSLILGIVEGFTEFLPISSTAHLILASEFLGLAQTEFVKTFEISIQSGAMFAVIFVYWKRFLDFEVIKRLAAAFIPTAILGFALYELVKDRLIGNVSVVLWALALGGAFLIAFEIYVKKNAGAAAQKSANVAENPADANADENEDEIKNLGYIKSALIGTAQAVAIIPGVSRSAATIIGGLLAGMSRTAVVEFSFLLAVPTILAATGLDVLKNASLFTADQAGLLAVGFVTAFITALLGIKFLLAYVRTRSFIGFGIYRIAIVALFLLIFI